MEEQFRKIRSLSSAMGSMERSMRNPKPQGFDKNIIRINPTVFQRLDEMAVKQKWKEIVGPLFAESAQSIVLTNKILYVTIRSAAIKNELIMNKSVIVERINKELNKVFVNDMVVK
ncbi:MAG: DUF721 domain-containing protein [Bacteroidales bacterium]|nr:DUF721 domain-containing protein [Bacteroidales bacterium]